MKKYLVTIMLVILIATLFVACSSSPKEDELPYVAEITVTGSGKYADYTGTYYLKGGDDHYSGEDEFATVFTYKVYKDKECTDPLYYLIEDVIPTEYSFAIGINSSNSNLHHVTFTEKNICFNQAAVIILTTPCTKAYLKASFCAGDEYMFNDEDIEITIKFV